MILRPFFIAMRMIKRVGCKTNLNYKKFRLVFLCNLYKWRKKREV